MNRIVKAIVVLLLSIPLAVAFTLFTFPLWRWFEASTGIESVGHSGPATWCYLLMYVLLAVIGILSWTLTDINKKSSL